MQYNAYKLFLLVTFLLIQSTLAQGQTSSVIETQQLIQGKPLEREMKGDEIHRYQITLGDGQLLKLTVDQRGVDVLITTFSPDGAKIAEFDSPNGTLGPEPVSIAAKTSGAFQIEVRSLEANAPAGRYEIKIDDILSAGQYRQQLAEEKAKDEAVIAQLKKQAISLKSLSAGNGFDDLQPLKKILKNVRLVGLGEATHGTHEFFTFKHRMVEFLVKEMGFTVFLIEASASASIAINDYVLYGKGSRAEALASQKYWIPDTVEFSEMLDWMRSYNQNLPEEKKIKFVGFDPQVNEKAMLSVIEYLQKFTPEKVSAAQILFQSLQKEDDNAAKFAPAGVSLPQLLETYKLIGYFVINKADLVRKSSERGFEETLQNLRLIAQFAELNSRSAVSPQDYETRDALMAENIQAIVSQQKPETRIIVWAHNAHISTRSEGGSQTMGSDLRNAFGNKYYAFGFSFNRGSFQAQNVDEKEVKVQEFTLEAAPEKTVDWYFAQTGIKNFIIDFRNSPKDNLFFKWLQTERKMYWVGALFSNHWNEARKTQRFVLSHNFDGIIFIEQTTRAVPTISVKIKD